MKALKQILSILFVLAVIALAIYSLIEFMEYQSILDSSYFDQFATEPNVPVPVDEETVITDIHLTNSEINDLATIVFLKGGTESYECQKAIASVVLNRISVEGKSLKEVIYESNQFDTEENVLHSKPTKSTMNAVLDVIETGTTLPSYVTFCRDSHYHEWGDRYIPYIQIDNTYFSYDVELKEKLEDEV